MLTNFELKRLKPKLDIAKKPENRVHELTDSNVSRSNPEQNPLVRTLELTQQTCLPIFRSNS